MKTVLVIGDLNSKLKSVLEACLADKLISKYINYELYNAEIDSINTSFQISSNALTNAEFCMKFIQNCQCFNDILVLKGDIHTDDFLRILIKMEKVISDDKIFLSHIIKLSSKNKDISFYLSDCAINTKHLEDADTLVKVIDNAQTYIKNKEGLTEIKTNLILAADNKNIPGHAICTEVLVHHNFDNNLSISQFDECFDLAAWLIKHKDADAFMFTYPKLIITPDITVGNCIWKALTILNDWSVQGYVIGGKLNTILLSRSDSEDNYYKTIKTIVQEEKAC